MGFKIISNCDEEGNFIDAAEAWTPERIEALLKKYNPNGKIHYAVKEQESKEALQNEQEEN